MARHEWKERKLGEIIELKYGKGLPQRERIKGDIPVYGSAGIVDNHNEALVKSPGIIVGRKGNVGSVFFSKVEFFPIDTVFYIDEKPGQYNLKFIYYLLKNSHLSELNQDAAVPGLNRNTALLQVFSIPSEIALQKKIAGMLSNYDNLIENNSRRIQLLESMAKLIYDEWFVKFKFPGHEKVKMVDSDIGEIPEGWEVKKLGESLDSIESGLRPKGGVGELSSGIPSIGAENINGLGNYDYNKEKYVSVDFFHNMNRGIVKHKDVLLYKDGAKIGRKSIFRNDYPHKICCINEHVFILRTKSGLLQNYLYFWLDQNWMTEKIKNLNANAAQPGINQEGVKSLPILIPKFEVLKIFNGMVDSILCELFTLAKKNQNLASTRDLLLPRLISGELDVSELDIKVSEVEV